MQVEIKNDEKIILHLNSTTPQFLWTAPHGCGARGISVHKY
jgi:hypothetical protein